MKLKTIKCINSEGSFSCECRAGFHGTGHDNIPGTEGCYNINECVVGRVNCDQNAKCIDIAGDGLYRCNCNPGSVSYLFKGFRMTHTVSELLNHASESGGLIIRNYWYLENIAIQN